MGQDPSTQRFVGDQSRRSVTLAQIREDDREGISRQRGDAGHGGVWTFGPWSAGQSEKNGRL